MNYNALAFFCAISLQRAIDAGKDIRTRKKMQGQLWKEKLLLTLNCQLFFLINSLPQGLKKKLPVFFANTTY